MLQITGLSAGYMGCSIIRDIQLSIEPGTFFAIIGPNGSGKSTLLQTLSGQLSPMQGHIYWNGQDLHKCSARERATLLATLDQLADEQSELTVQERVALARIPHQSRLFPVESDQDKAIISQEIQNQKVEFYANQLTNRLSGGEQQRVRLAKTFAQRTKVILLDEPTNHLDIHHTLDLLDSLKEMQSKNNIAIVAILHDINLAARFADQIAIMNQGKIVKQGKPSDCLDIESIKQIFKIDTYKIEHPTLHCPQFFVK